MKILNKFKFNPDELIFLAKLKKYGNQNKNLLITILILLCLAFVVNIYKVESKGITDIYTKYYPENTDLYLDVYLTKETVSEINKITGLTSSDISNLIIKLFKSDSDNLTEIKSLTSQAFGNSFSYGTWIDKEKIKKRTLAIFPVERECKVNCLVDALKGKKSELKQEVYQGYKINLYKNNERAYIINEGKLFIADSYKTLTYIIDNFFITSSQSLIKNKRVKNSLNHLETKRIGTIIINNQEKFNEIRAKIPQSFQNYNKNYNDIIGSLGLSIISAMFDQDSIYFKSYTPIDFNKIKDNKVRKAYEKILGFDKSLTPYSCLPKNVLLYTSMNNLGEYIDLNLEILKLKSSSNYVYFKEFVKMLTAIDLEEDLINNIKDEVSLFVIDNGNKNYKTALLVKSNDQLDNALNKACKFLSMQLPYSKTSKVSYKNMNLSLIKMGKYDNNFYYGNLPDNIFALGEKEAIESLIDYKADTQNNEKCEIIKRKITKEPIFLAYADFQKLKKMQKQNKVIKDKYLKNLEKNIKTVVLSINTDKNHLEGILHLIMNKSTKNNKL